MTKAKPRKTKKIKVPKLKEIYGKKTPDYARRKRADILQKMVTEAEEDGLYEKLDVTLEQVRIVELEAENARLSAMLTRLFEHQQRHDPDPGCPICTGVAAYLEGRPLTEDQQREFDQP